MVTVRLGVLSLLLAIGCSEGSEGGASTGAGGGTTEASSSSAGGDDPADDLNPATADWFVERLPGEWDSAAQSEADPTLVAKHLSACRIDAPELGERVVYLERSDLASVDEPFEQLVVAVAPISRWYSIAGATFFAPDDPAAWRGLCGLEDQPSAPGPVRELVGCEVEVNYDDTQFHLWMDYGPLPACDPRPPAGARSARTHLRFQPRVWWTDAVLLEDGTTVHDPGADREYVLDRVGP